MYKLRTKDGEIIKLNNGVWSGENSALVEDLSSALTPEIIEGHTPDFDYSLAELAVDRYGMEIVSRGRTPAVPGYPYTVY